MPTGGVDILVAAGVDAATAATISSVVGTGLVDAGIGAGIGGVVGGVENGGKGILKGAEAGGLTGLGGGVGGAALGGFGGAALGGAVGGGLGAEVTGGNPLTGALEGGAGAGISSALGGTTNLFGTTGTPITGGTANAPLTGSGGTTAAPSGIGGVDTGGDVTAGLDSSTQAAAPIGQVSSNNLPALSGDTGGTGNTGLGSSPNASTGSSTSTSANVNQTTGTPTIGGSDASLAPSTTSPNTGGSPVSANTGNGGIDNLVNNFSASQSAATPPTDALNQNVISDLNAATSGGVDRSLTQPGILADITGSPIAQGGGTPIGAAASGVGGAQPNSIATAFNTPTGSNIMSAIGNNLGPLVAGGGVIADAAMNKQALPGQKEISNEAGQLAAQGQTLQSYLQTGTLPPGLKGALDSASESAIATIKSQYAAHGMSGSSAEQDAIANVQQTVASQGAQLALQLLSTGVSESEGASQLYQSIMNSALSEDQSLGQAIGRFATSFAGGVPAVNIGRTA